MKKTYYILLALIIATLVVIPSCKSKKVVTEKPKITSNNGRKIIDCATGAQPTFKEASVSNAKLTLEAKSRKISATADIDINYDEAIKVGVKVMGIEMAIAEIRPQNIRLIDKLNRRYADATYDEIQKMTGIPLTFKDVQALLCNQVFCIGTPSDKLKSLRPQTSADEAGNTKVTFTDNNRSMALTIQRSDCRINNTEISLTDKNYTLNTAYNQLKDDDSVSFPHEIIIRASSNKHNASVTIKLPTIRFNKGAFTTPYNTNKLTKVPLSTFMQYL